MEIIIVNPLPRMIKCVEQMNCPACTICYQNGETLNIPPPTKGAFDFFFFFLSSQIWENDREVAECSRIIRPFQMDLDLNKLDPKSTKRPNLQFCIVVSLATIISLHRELPVRSLDSNFICCIFYSHLNLRLGRVLTTTYWFSDRFS